jgi:PAS domain S-box-containing protein
MKQLNKAPGSIKPENNEISDIMFFDDNQVRLSIDSNFHIFDPFSSCDVTNEKKLDKMIGKNLIDLFPLSSKLRIIQQLKALNPTRPEISFVQNIKDQLSGTKLIYWNVKAILKANGKITQYEAREVDISKLNLSHQKLIDSERWFRALFNKAKDAIFVYLPKTSSAVGKFIEVNDVACRRYGYTKAEILQLTPSDLSDQDYFEGFSERIDKALTDKHILFESIQITKNKKKFPVEINSHRFEYNGKPIVISIVRDITERKKTEEERRKTLKFLKKSEKALIKVNQKLTRKNTAFEEVLEQVELQKQNIKHDVITNIDEILLPLLMQIKLVGSDVVQGYVNLIEKSFKDLTSSFGRKITQTSLKLTAREVQLCNLIRSNLSSKEISQLLNISKDTVGRHRTNIRRKLGITNEKINLSVILQNM